MPATPKFRHGFGAVGNVEVFPDADAQKQSASHRHIHVAGKVRIELNGVKHHHQQNRESVVSFPGFINRVDDIGNAVGDYQLLHDAEENTVAPSHTGIIVKRMGGEELRL